MLKSISKSFELLNDIEGTLICNEKYNNNKYIVFKNNDVFLFIEIFLC